MKVKDAETWAKDTVLEEDDAYIQAIIDYAIRWADLMEHEMERRSIDGFDAESIIPEIAKECGREADAEGVTGNMYGFAGYLIARHWVYGEPFRLWFNVDCDPEHGRIANDTPGAMLNPAVFVVGGG